MKVDHPRKETNIQLSKHRFCASKRFLTIFEKREVSPLSRFKTRPSGSSHDLLFTKSYTSLNYRRFFIAVGTVVACITNNSFVSFYKFYQQLIIEKRSAPFRLSVGQPSTRETRTIISTKRNELTV